MRRFRLLPPNEELGWTPYVWLLYILPFAAGPFLVGAEPRALLITLFGLVCFLTLYFSGFWLRGGRLLVVIILMVALGLIYTPINPGAGGMFIFAGAFAANLGTTRHGAIAIAVIVSVALIQALIVDLPVWVWAPITVFTIAIGAVNLHDAERRRVNAKLRMAQEQIEHLAKVAERERISRDLHDLLGHTLSLIVLKAELSGKLFDRSPERAKEEIREVERIARDALCEVREAVRGYRASGLMSEIRRSVVLLENAGIAVRQSVSEINLDPEQGAMMELALRESVTNVIRHAAASTVWITLETIDGRAVLEVRDDGRGGIADEGMGLRGMRERAAASGGLLSIDTSDGFRVRVELSEGTA